MVPQTTSTSNERRRWPRFNTQEGCLIFESSGVVGEVRDISAGGMSIHTIYVLPDHPDPCEDGILCCQNILMENIEYQVVNDCVLPRNFEFSTIVQRRYGIRFTNLTEMQKKNLEQIIKICQSA